jgi:hypothetical protein
VGTPLPKEVYWRRRALALGAVVLTGGGILAAAPGGDSDQQGPGQAAQATPTPTPPPELPGGGRTILPDKRVVAFYGAPQADELGELGIGTPDSAGRRLLRQAKRYDRERRPIMPAMELIAVIAAAHPGADGKYRTRQDPKVIRRYLRAARRIGALLILDIQPGRSDFFSETLKLRRWLREPDVGLALDPEWRVTDGQVPGKVIGRVEPREVNATSAWLQQLIDRHDLPQKLFVIHEFTDDMVDEQEITERPGLAMIFNVDGFGGREIKIAKYRSFARQAPPHAHIGFKLFYREDTGLMQPRHVLRLKPKPDLVVYE